jgi:hypothetical protein
MLIYKRLGYRHIIQKIDLPNDVGAANAIAVLLGSARVNRERFHDADIGDILNNIIGMPTRYILYH